MARRLWLAALLFRCSPAQGAEQLLWGPFSDGYGLEVLKSEVEKSLLDGSIPRVDTLAFKVPESGEEPAINPFKVAGQNFAYGDYFAPRGRTSGAVPEIEPRDAAWFQELVDRGVCPRFFMIAGHQVISHGWHDHSETRFMFLPTFLATVRKYPAARRILNCVRVAVLFGCNTMTNLEPHRPDGGTYSPEEIRALYESGPEGRERALGTPALTNTLEFYRERLAREYGPSNPDGRFEYYRDKSLKKCLFMRQAHGKQAPVENVDCVMPDQGLFDGTRRYNYPFIMRELFPRASLVLGFSSPSPNNKPASLILGAAIEKAREELNQTTPKTSPEYLENILYPLADDKTPRELAERIVAAIRKHWSLETFRRNRGRPSGSVSPRFPQLDREGIIHPEVLNTILAEAKRRGIVLNASAYGP